MVIVQVSPIDSILTLCRRNERGDNSDNYHNLHKIIAA